MTTVCEKECTCKSSTMELPIKLSITASCCDVESTPCCDCGDFEQDFSGDGWTKLPNGLILQWGLGKTATRWTDLTFPIPFPTRLLSVTATDHTQEENGSENISIVGIAYPEGVETTKTKIRVYTKLHTGAVKADEFSWMAIGY